MWTAWQVRFSPSRPLIWAQGCFVAAWMQPAAAWRGLLPRPSPLLRLQGATIAAALLAASRLQPQEAVSLGMHLTQ